MKYKAAYLVLLLLSLAASAPAWGALSPAEEARLGKQLMAEARPLGLTADASLDAVGARLAKTTTRKDITWRFWVVEGMKEFNAFAAPGGFVFISRPYFEKLNEDETAFVIGHEMAHVDLGHHEKEMKRSQRANLGNLLLRVLVSNTLVGTAADIGATAYVSHYSRVLEREADLAGYRYCEQAGYHPSAAVTAFGKLGKEDKLPPWLANIYSTHPILSSREDQLAALGGKKPDTSSPPPPSPAHQLNGGLKLDPPVPVAVRILGADGKRWEGTWRKSFTKVLHDRLTPFGFTIAGDDLMYKPDIGDPVAAAHSRHARYLLLVTVQEMASKSDGPAKPLGQPVKATLKATARVLEVSTSDQIWSTSLQGAADGVDLLPTDPATLYTDTTLGGLVWQQAGEMAKGLAKKLSAEK